MSGYEGAERRTPPPASRTQVNWAAISVIVVMVLSGITAAIAYGQGLQKVEENAEDIEDLRTEHRNSIDRLEEKRLLDRAEVGDEVRRIDDRLTDLHGVTSAQTQAIIDLTQEIRAMRGRDGAYE